MIAAKDVYGKLIWNYYKGKRSFEIIERDDGYINGSSSGPKVYFSDYKDWPSHEKEAIKYVKGRVLDIGCGVGRHSLWLQKKGLSVLGIDSSPLAIRVCKLRGLKKAKIMAITDINFKPNSFDTIIMLGNNFGLFGDFKSAKRLLKKFYKITSDKALIVAESTDPYKTDNPAHLRYHKLNRKRGRMGGQVRIRVRFEKFIGNWFDYLLVSKKEMGKIVEGTGWKIRKFIDSKKAAYIAIIEKI
ncbi:MAG: class I SAM-dependent methyltransferase [Candidatus Thermoplasmatota archaeon]|nr:class I SAM-dependent methyltransferase [Candidatus Thermoplasmatota archaeon]